MRLPTLSSHPYDSHAANLKDQHRVLVPQVLALSRVPSTTASAAPASAQLQPQGEGVWTPVRRFIAGYFSGCALVLAGHPFDTIKVRLQHEAGAGGRFKGVVDCVQQTVRGEGLLALYKGVLPPLVMTGGINCVLFGLQGMVSSAIVRHSGATSEAMDSNGLPAPSVRQIMAAAVISGALISVPVAPMERIKAQLQVQYNAAGSKGTFSGPVDCAKQIVRSQGLVGLFRGWLPTCLCRMSNYSYFGGYAYFRKVFNPEGGKMGLVSSVGAGGAAGVCYWLSCYPMDVVKNRMMSAPASGPLVYTGMLDCFRKVYAAGGTRAFFAGFTPCLLRAIPANSACFLAYELAMTALPEQWPL